MPLYIGLMSGTSMDGIDAALVDVDTNHLIHGLTMRYDPVVKKDIEHLISEQNLSLAAVCKVNTLIGRSFAAAANDLLREANISPKNVVAIGNHGQTVAHNTQCEFPYTMQLGCSHTIATSTNIQVVADFRTRDVVLNGQGAPFAPLYHQILFAHLEQELALVNVGGIANISFINQTHDTSGFDTGPGNCLMDAWVNKQLGLPFDKNGSFAKKGRVIAPLLECLLSDDFIQKEPPKSISKEHYSLAFLEQYLQPSYAPEDIQATLVALTAYPIARAMQSKPSIKHLAVCGGGAHNQSLMHQLSEYLPSVTVCSTSSFGLSPDYIEAMMFAWFAAQMIENKPIDMQKITGSIKPAVLGVLYPRDNPLS